MCLTQKLTRLHVPVSQWQWLLACQVSKSHSLLTATNLRSTAKWLDLELQLENQNVRKRIASIRRIWHYLCWYWLYLSQHLDCKWLGLDDRWRQIDLSELASRSLYWYLLLIFGTDWPVQSTVRVGHYRTLDCSWRIRCLWMWLNLVLIRLRHQNLWSHSLWVVHWTKGASYDCWLRWCNSLRTYLSVQR